MENCLSRSSTVHSHTIVDIYIYIIQKMNEKSPFLSSTLLCPLSSLNFCSVELNSILVVSIWKFRNWLLDHVMV